MTLRYCLVSALFIFVSLVSQLQAQDQPAKRSYTLIKNVKIFDGLHDELTSGNVLIENNLLKEVGVVKVVPEGTQVLDGGGHTLMPGLIDAHVHLTIPRNPKSRLLDRYYRESRGSEEAEYGVRTSAQSLVVL